MPKLKTRKSMSKRVKRTGTGKYVHFRAGKRHLQTGKTASRRRRLSNGVVAHKTDEKRIKACLPYGI